MKKDFLKLSAVLLLFFSGGIFAQDRVDKVIIKEKPIVIQKEGDTDVYVVPAPAAPTAEPAPAPVIGPADHYVFTIGTEKRVCFKEVQPALKKIDLGALKVRVAGDLVSLHCYTYDPEYFTEEEAY